MKRPLVIHVADRQMQEGIGAFFLRADWHIKLACERFDFDPKNRSDLFRIPGCTDPGLYQGAGANLRAHQSTHAHAIVMLDSQFPGSPGTDDTAAEAIRAKVLGGLQSVGWQRDAIEVIVIRPMLEAWLWTDSPHVEGVFGHNPPPSLRQRMRDAGLWPADAAKPTDLKTATATAARWGGKKSDAALFKNVLGSGRSLTGCIEPGFVLLRQTLKRWFPPEAPAQ